MSRRHAITPTDKGLVPNKDWCYSPPVVLRDGRTVVVDAMQLPMLLDYYAAAGVPLVSEDELQARRSRKR